MPYLTKDKQGLIQLWVNKPEFNEVMDCYFAWIDKGVINEVPIDVTSNDYIRGLFATYDVPCCIDITSLNYKIIKV